MPFIRGMAITPSPSLVFYLQLYAIEIGVSPKTAFYTVCPFFLFFSHVLTPAASWLF
jgi:hypothetical protein